MKEGCYEPPLAPPVSFSITKMAFNVLKRKQHVSLNHHHELGIGRYKLIIKLNIVDTYHLDTCNYI